MASFLPIGLECNGLAMGQTRPVILFDLECDSGHVFEGWFPSGADYDQQAAKGQIRCPVCDTVKVKKAPMAQRPARGQDREPERKQAQAAMLQALRKLRRTVEKNSTYVGDRFPAEARAMYAGECEEKSIYGEATCEEARELREEGVPVCPLPWIDRADH